MGILINLHFCHCYWEGLDNPNIFSPWFLIQLYSSLVKEWVFFLTIPSRKLTYPPKIFILKMIFLFPRWDMLIPWRVHPKNRSCCFLFRNHKISTWLATWNVHHLRRINATALNGLASRECPPPMLWRFGRIGSHFRTFSRCKLHGKDPEKLEVSLKKSSKVFVGVAKEKTKRTNHNTGLVFFGDCFLKKPWDSSALENHHLGEYV